MNNLKLMASLIALLFALSASGQGNINISTGLNNSTVKFINLD